MSKPSKRTIDPKKVTSLEKWVQYHESYGNVVEGPNHTFHVLDPKTMDAEAPVKTFEIAKAYDAITVLQSEELRAFHDQARTLLETAGALRTSKVATLNQQYKEREHELLKQIQVWKTSSEAGTKSLLADIIGRLQKELGEIDTARREAKYPHRFLLTEKLARSKIYPATRDERLLPYSVFRTVPQTTIVKERILTEEGTA
jgi:hypothetical protein